LQRLRLIGPRHDVVETQNTTSTTVAAGRQWPAKKAQQAAKRHGQGRSVKLVCSGLAGVVGRRGSRRKLAGVGSFFMVDAEGGLRA